MRVCKHGCDVGCFVLRALITRARILKRFSDQNSTSSLYLLIPSLLKIEKSLQTSCVNFFSLKLTFSAKKICILESIFLQNKN